MAGSKSHWRDSMALEWAQDETAPAGIHWSAKLPPAERIEVGQDPNSELWWFKVRCFDADGRQLFYRAGERLANYYAARVDAELAFDAWRHQSPAGKA